MKKTLSLFTKKMTELSYDMSSMLPFNNPRHYRILLNRNFHELLEMCLNSHCWTSHA